MGWEKSVLRTRAWHRHSWLRLPTIACAKMQMDGGTIRATDDDLLTSNMMLKFTRLSNKANAEHSAAMDRGDAIFGGELRPNPSSESLARHKRITFRLVTTSFEVGLSRCWQERVACLESFSRSYVTPCIIAHPGTLPSSRYCSSMYIAHSTSESVFGLLKDWERNKLCLKSCEKMLLKQTP